MVRQTDGMIDGEKGNTTVCPETLKFTFQICLQAYQKVNRDNQFVFPNGHGPWSLLFFGVSGPPCFVMLIGKVRSRF